MKEILNNALIPMVNEGLIGASRIISLIEIKEFIDNISTRGYIEKRDADEISKKYGVMPDIITWGDYFQTELASSLVNKTDEEFFLAIETVKYDMISSCIIFSEKESDFFQWVDESYYQILSSSRDEHTDEEKEIVHLKILKDYYLDLGITDNFSEATLEWYNSFKEAMAI
jgi:hypothetical protein